MINPDEYLETYGADVLRTYLMFVGPYEAGGEFSDRGIGGIVRFLDRVWRMATKIHLRGRGEPEIHRRGRGERRGGAEGRGE